MTSDLRDVTLHLVETVDDAAALMRWLGERRPVERIACDTETTGLDPFTERVRLVQFGDTETAWTVPWEDWGGVVREVFRRYEGRYVFHNGPAFDCPMLKYACGVDVPEDRVDDTMIAAHVHDSSQRVALKSLAARLVDPRAGYADAMLTQTFADNDWDWATIPIEVPAYGVYAAMDCILTARLADVIFPQVQAQAQAAYELEVAFAFAVQRMRERGTHVDTSYTEERLAEFEAYIASVDAWAKKEFNVRPGSNASVLKRFQEDGLVIPKYTCGCVSEDGAAPVEFCEKAGRHLKQLAVDKEVLLEATRLGHPLAEPVLTRRRAQKLASTYLTSFIELADADGLVHPEMRSLGARTGRMSIRTPPLQTLPRRSEANPLAIEVRNCVTPRAGHVMLLTDWDQIEVRMLASLSGDQGMIDAFGGDVDFFTQMCRGIFHDDTIAKSDPRRQVTKNAVYGRSYGAGVAKFSLTAGIPVSEGRAFMDQLDASYPGITMLQTEVERRARERLQSDEGRAYVVSPLTGRRHYAAKNRLYVLVNYLIQGTAAEVLKRKTIELENAGVGEHMHLLVHDEVVMDVPVEHVREIRAVTESVMNDADLFTVPITASADAAWRWGQKGDFETVLATRLEKTT